jgi:outer membrane receptor protein involved in Fe transport
VADGWGLFINFNEMPFMAQYKPGKEDVKARSNRFSIYVQDSWKLTDRLSINPGIRFDYTVGKNDVLEIINDYKTFSPRFGFVYQLTNDGKTILKGNYSKYYENPFLFFPDVFSKGKTPLYLYMYNPWTAEYDILLMELSAESFEFLNELKSPNLNEFILGIEREILPNFSMGVTGIYRKAKDIIEDVETNMLYEDPDNPYTPTGSKDGTGNPVLSVGNPDEAYRQYKGLEITLEKRMANNWMFLGSYTLSETKGTVATSFTGFLDSAGETVNRDGYLSPDRRHIVKLAGSYIFPYGIHLGFQYRHLSGFPYTKLLINPFYNFYGMYETPLGADDPATGIARRYPSLNTLDLRIEKTFRVGKGNLGVYADIYNTFNADTPISYYTFDNPQYETVSSRTSPIHVRLNVRYSF